MRVDSEGWPVDAEQLASQPRFNPEFAQKSPTKLNREQPWLLRISLSCGNRNLIQRFSRSN
jgi:hypothetical protein